jgi:hypothetical protein
MGCFLLVWCTGYDCRQALSLEDDLDSERVLEIVGYAFWGYSSLGFFFLDSDFQCGFYEGTVFLKSNSVFLFIVSFLFVEFSSHS